MKLLRGRLSQELKSSVTEGQERLRAGWLGSMSSAGLKCFQEEGRHALEAAVMNREHMLPAFEVRESRNIRPLEKAGGDTRII